MKGIFGDPTVLLAQNTIPFDLIDKINQNIDTITEHFREKALPHITDRIRSADCFDYFKKYLCCLLDKIPSLQKAWQESAGLSGLQMAKDSVCSADLDLCADRFSRGLFFPNGQIVSRNNNVNRIFSFFMHETGHAVERSLQSFEKKDLLSNEAVSQLFELYSFLILQNYKVGDTANLLSARIGSVFSRFSLAALGTEEYTDGFVAAVRALSLVKKELGDSFDLHDLNQQGRMLDRAIGLLYKKKYSKKDVLQWTTHLNKYLDDLFACDGKSWEQSLIGLQSDQAKKAYFDVQKFLKELKGEDVENRGLDIKPFPGGLSRCFCAAFNQANIGTQMWVLALTLFSRDFFLKNTRTTFGQYTNTVFKYFFKYQPLKCFFRHPIFYTVCALMVPILKDYASTLPNLLGYGLLNMVLSAALMGGVSLLNHEEILRPAFDALEQVRKFCVSFWKPSKKAKIFQKKWDYDHFGKKFLFKNVSARTWNFAFPLFVLSSCRFFGLIPEMRTSVLSVMYAPIVTCAEIF